MLTNILISIFALGSVIALWFFYDLFSNLIKATKQWDEERNKKNKIRLENFKSKNFKEWNPLIGKSMSSNYISIIGYFEDQSDLDYIKQGYK